MSDTPITPHAYVPTDGEPDAPCAHCGARRNHRIHTVEHAGETA